LLQHTADAPTAEEYLQRQSDCIQALLGQSESLCAIVRDRSAPLQLRFEALQALSWLCPDDLDTFLTGSAASPDEPEVAEAARALLFRNNVRRNVSAKYPARFAAYLENVRLEFAKVRFSDGKPND
jgi:hypothetical protein